MRAAHVHKLVERLCDQGWPRGYIAFLTGFTAKRIQKIVARRNRASTVRTKRAA